MEEKRESDRYTREKWYKNIWYHHKVLVITVLFLVSVTGIFLYNSLTKDKTDLYIIYITADPEVYTEKVAALRNTVAKYTSDINGDGYTVVFIDNIYIGDDHQDDVIYKNKERIMTILRSGICMLLAFDDYGYEYLKNADTLYDLSEIMGNEENLAYLLNGTAFMENDTIKMTYWGSNVYLGLRVYEGTVAELLPNSQKNFEIAYETLKNIIKDKKVESENE